MILVLFLNVTGVFRFLAWGIGIEIWLLSSFMLAYTLVYLMICAKYTIQNLKNPVLILWGVFMIFWPALSSTYSPVSPFSKLALNALLFSLALSTAVLLSRGKIGWIRILINVTFLTVVFGVILSFFMPEIFKGVASLANAKNDYGGRAFGFALQPNMVTTELILSFCIWLGFFHKKNPLRILVALSIFGIAILLTTSRSGVVLFFVVAFLIIIFMVKVNITKSNNLHSIHVSSLGSKRVACISAFGFILLFFGLSFLSENAQEFVQSQRTGFYFVERINLFSEGKLSDVDVASDRNIRARVEAQKPFYEMISQRPIFGYGIGSRDYYKEKGFLPKSSHSQYLRIAFEYGIFHAFLLILLFLYPVFSSKRRFVEEMFSMNWILQFSLSSIMLCLVSNTVLQCRIFWLILGVALFFFILPKIRLIKGFPLSASPINFTKKNDNPNR